MPDAEMWTHEFVTVIVKNLLEGEVFETQVVVQRADGEAGEVITDPDSCDPVALKREGTFNRSRLTRGSTVKLVEKKGLSNGLVRFGSKKRLPKAHSEPGPASKTQSERPSAAGEGGIGNFQKGSLASLNTARQYDKLKLSGGTAAVSDTIQYVTPICHKPCGVAGGCGMMRLLGWCVVAYARTVLPFANCNV